MWSADHLVALAAAALRAEEDRYRLEQAYAGLDALEETGLHPVLARGLGAEEWGEGGYGVLGEQRYPAQWMGRKGRRKALPEDSERQRCDLVLTPRRGQRLADTLARAREEEAGRGTLFEGAVMGGEAPAADVIGAGEAYWLEVKVVGQYCYCSGVPGPNGAYGSELVRGVTSDLRKLEDDPAIERGGAMLILFTEGEEVARHDLMTLTHRCLDLQLPVRSPVMEHVAIADRIGNRACTAWLMELGSRV